MPTETVTPVQCTAGLNTVVAEGSEIMKTGGQLTGLTYQVPADLRQGSRSLTIFDLSIDLPLPDGRVSDQVFLNTVEKSEAYRAWKADPARCSYDQANVHGTAAAWV